MKIFDHDSSVQRVNNPFALAVHNFDFNNDELAVYTTVLLSPMYFSLLPTSEPTSG